jgi:hypothetical protein
MVGGISTDQQLAEAQGNTKRNVIFCQTAYQSQMPRFASVVQSTPRGHPKGAHVEAPGGSDCRTCAAHQNITHIGCVTSQRLLPLLFLAGAATALAHAAADVPRAYYSTSAARHHASSPQ